MSQSDIKPALLTRTETEWLLDNLKISKAYEYRIKSDIKKKLNTFTEIEIPLLIQKGFIDSRDLSNHPQNLIGIASIAKTGSHSFSFLTLSRYFMHNSCSNIRIHERYVLSKTDVY